MIPSLVTHEMEKKKAAWKGNILVSEFKKASKYSA